MSHLKERKEKNCLNCNAEVAGRYCHICGQENVEPKESAWHLVVHFFEDITHFDGKFFTTLWLLIRKPGFLSAEYARGRRASYLNPIRMYVFTSAIFFLVFFSVFKMDPHKSKPLVVDIYGRTLEQVNQMDSSAFAEFTTTINKDEDRPAKPMTREEFMHYYDSSTRELEAMQFTSKYKSKEEYDSLLKAGAVKDGWFGKMIRRKELEMKDRFRSGNNEVFSVMLEAFLHKLPQMLFVSLPILALLLKLFYVRRKEFYYVNHGIFSIHLYIFTFIALLMIFGLSKLSEQTGWSLFSYVKAIFIMAIFFYWYKAMRNFYHQRRAKTIVKYLLLMFTFTFAMALLFSIFFLISAFTV